MTVTEIGAELDAEWDEEVKATPNTVREAGIPTAD
jgi:hypothetical protein